MLPSVAGKYYSGLWKITAGQLIKKWRHFMSKGKVWTQAKRNDFIFFLSGTPGEELSKEEKNLAIMAMKKKDKRLYDRIMHSKKKKRSEVNYFSVNFFSSFIEQYHDVWFIVVYNAQLNIEENHSDARITCYNIKLISRVSLLPGRGEERPWERRCHSIVIRRLYRSCISNLTW